jgi:hypothetical protein
MKKALIGGLLVAGLIGLAGCQSNKGSANMGAVGEKSCSTKTECCQKKDASGNMGAVSTKSECCSKKAATGNMGAVSEKSECSSKASSCSTKTTCTSDKKVN